MKARELIKRMLERAHLEGLAREVNKSLHYLSWSFKRGFGRVDHSLVDGYLRRQHVRKLHIGCGSNILNGWLNSDLRPHTRDVLHLDATKRFPFDDELFDYIFSEHMIEHVSYAEGLFMLGECYRILKKNGRIRLSTPNQS